ncbi:5-dehydro-4-deoxyglucarate dehydratase [Nocardia macrotermitis]|uniref:Probable 5-dehydro-4-deoxyglucarate dehydratase n=1 Tax=Nocardia macrotermitis TaxID=2585198 RepID=A0A7K0D040_9NOCA|nr:5-dehydro-4-deoxyglucarate dehydratase [Nocardia macrotermitis]MQY19093.1 putative 5-dehydro-4-deoxyglucarate dehydratase [Nocardia macrotermitis]
MSQISAEDLGPALGRGLLSFPVTHFDDELAFDEAAYREHIGWLAQYDVAGLFAAGGTGEGFSLTTPEIDRVVRAAVAETEGRVPVLAPATAGTAIAVEQARNAEAAGAQGILLLPPYLTEAGPDGLVEHVAAVCAATSLGVIFYSRANARVDDVTVARMAERCPNLVGFKDGVGNIETMTRIYARMGDRLTYIGGLPTAETFALPYIEMGVTTYSSAIFNFVPEFALEFYQAVRAHDRDEVYRRLRNFVLPYLDIRDRRAGYAVSIIKAGLTAVGRPSSRVRPPLTDLTEGELVELTELVKSIA